jgi:cellulose synthase/poly-beta-1,6-N-acetylglucosamine synthase-like glycosyltransferase
MDRKIGVKPLFWPQLIFWAAIGTVLYTFLGYPLLAYLLARYRRRPVKQAAITPSVTLLVAAYNEAAVIVDKIENSLQLDYPADLRHIVIVADGSDDETVALAEQYADQRVIVYHQPDRRGKAAAINRVMPLISDEIIVFSDANTMLDPAALKLLVRNFADPTVGGVAGEKRVMGGGEGLYWRYESSLKRWDSAISSVMGAAGELFAVRRALFQPPEEDALIEDFVISLRLVAAGWRVVYEAEAAALEAPSPSIAGEWQRRARNAAGGFRSIQRLPELWHPRLGLITWQYLSHRVLRWAVTPFLLPFIYGLNLILWTSPLYFMLLIGQTLFYALAVFGFMLERQGKTWKPAQVIFYFCFTNAAAIAGFWRHLARRQPVTWPKIR